jgi:CheY-like chemotaxis protein
MAAAGYRVISAAPSGPQFFRELRKTPPAAVVIDLSRIPSHGRDIAMGIRTLKSTRHIPIVFIEGDPEKTARIKQQLPDASYTKWPRIIGALKSAIAHPPVNPLIPGSALAGYSGTPLRKKLGIKEGSAVALLSAPEGLFKTLGDLPANVTFRDGIATSSTLLLWFVRSLRELRREVQQVASRVHNIPIWIAWPKKGSAASSDLTQQDVREAGLGAGLVDYKVCAIDETWSGLLFRKRRPKS